MKNVVILLSFVFCSYYHAYTQGLIVMYEETTSVQLPSNFNQIENSQIRAAIENSMKDRNMVQSKTAKLLVNNGVSVYKTGTSERQDREEMAEKEGNTNMSGSITRQINTTTPYLVYKNHLDRLMQSQANVGGKEYLIEEPLTEIKWKVGRKKRNISGYNCIEATAKTANGAPITAWYTPDIPISDGPSSYWGLPGLILFIDINDGMRVFSCTSIEQANDLLSIEAPSAGEKMSKAQYDKMIADHIQRMQENVRVERGENSIRRNGTMTIIR
ncbi:MAG: GLPGLI family protein [Bacteroidetes bacterium]|nr:GLPGLI family protein [Bacteroidota bacterium]